MQSFTPRQIQQIGKRQRLLIACVGLAAALTASICMVQAATPPMMVGLVILQIGVGLAVLIGAIRTAAALGYTLFPRILMTIGMFIPLIRLLILLSLNNRATTILRAAGLRVGFFGVSESELARYADTNACRYCGYTLTGNQSGYCPECGAACFSAGADAARPTAPTPPPPAGV